MTCLKLTLEEIMGKDMAALNHKPSRATAQEKVSLTHFTTLLIYNFLSSFGVSQNLIKYKSWQA